MRVKMLQRGERTGPLCGALGLLLLACSSQPLGPEPGGGDDRGQREARLITQADDELAPVVLSNNRFTWSAYRDGISLDQNLFFSPFSLSMALGMATLGARGTTEQQLQVALATKPGEEHHRGLGSLGADLGGEHRGRGYQLYTANKIFGDLGVPWSDEYLGGLDELYGAPLEQLSFQNDPELARNTVNAWVGEQTRRRVPELIHEGDFDSLTRFALVNASYFAAGWADAFDASKSYEGSFQLAGGQTAPVTFMTRRAQHRVSRQATFDLVELDYADRELSFLLLLPADPLGLPGFEASLSVELVDEALAAARDIDSVVELPRFTLRSELPLSNVLQALGVTAAFDPSLANFSGMLQEGAVVPLFLTRTRHQAFVQLDEQGTKAAAATAVVGGTRSDLPTFSANRAFVFLIRDKLTGTYLFAGRLVNPSLLAQ
jgi:serpin B